MNQNIEKWMPEARQLAAQCWCDPETENRTMDPALAEAAAKRIAAWMQTAAEFSNNESFYRGIVCKIGEMFGVEAKTSDDGSVQQDVLALKVPELVADLLAAHRGVAPRESKERAFLNGFSAMTDLTYKTHVDKGWTNGADPENLHWRGNQFMLMVGELAEGHEALRKGLMDDKLPIRLGEEVELADCIIRIMNYSRQRGLDVASALVEKARFNEGREFMHGGKKF